MERVGPIAQRRGDSQHVAERRVEFVRDAGDESCRAGELLGLHELPHRLLQIVVGFRQRGRAFADLAFEMFVELLRRVRRACAR